MSATVTILLPHHSVYREVLVGFHRIAADRGWVMVKEGQLWDDNPIQPDAIVCTAETWHQAEPGIRRDKPFVSALSDLKAEGIPSVVLDDQAIGRTAAEHLLARGLRSFAVYGVNEANHPNSFAYQRAYAFRQAALERGACYTGWGPDDASLLANSIAEWTHQVPRWLRAMPKPVGILSCCDSWAERLMAEIRLLGYKVPEEVSVVGADNEAYVCEMLTPALSSVIIPWERVGQELARLVEKLLAGQRVDPGPIVVPPGEVCTRRSSDFWAVDDPEVAAALSFIRDHADRVIGVPDVLRQTCTYRRNLERRFRRLIGHTIMDEVRRVRMARAKQLLSTTNLSIQEIAQRSGFADGRRLAESFQQELGLPPREYRQRYRLRG